jgi:hypothetical protein
VTDPAEDPVVLYKEILDSTRQAALKLSERDRKRSVEVAKEIVDADKKIKAATEENAKAAQEVKDWWRQVTARVAGVSWITPGPDPEPDPQADPKLLRRYMGDVEPKTSAFIAALRRASWPRRSV